MQARKVNEHAIYSRKLTKRVCSSIENDLVNGVREYLASVNREIMAKNAKKPRKTRKKWK